MADIGIPDDVPEDVWRTAAGEALKYLDWLGLGGLDADAEHVLTYSIARTVLAERTRWQPAVTYFDRYCQDEADDAENCLCGQSQHVDAKNFRDVAHPFARSPK